MCRGSGGGGDDGDLIDKLMKHDRGKGGVSGYRQGTKNKEQGLEMTLTLVHMYGVPSPCIGARQRSEREKSSKQMMPLMILKR